jgi:hypothetical protein
VPERNGSNNAIMHAAAVFAVCVAAAVPAFKLRAVPFVAAASKLHNGVPKALAL